MALGFSVTIRNAWLDSITSNAGASALLRFYSGTRPATGGTATTLLAELVCNATFAPAASGGVLTANAIANDSSANATGTATWFRVVKADGTTHVVDGDVGTSASDIVINTVSFVAGGPVAEATFIITAPNA